MIDAQSVGKASVRVCALAGTQVGPPRDASLLKARLCRFCSSQSWLFAFCCQAGRGWAKEKELSRSLGQKGQCWCSRRGLKLAHGGVKMLPLKESLQIISSAAEWHKMKVPWRALKSVLPLQLSFEPLSDLQTFSQTLISV